MNAMKHLFTATVLAAAGLLLPVSTAQAQQPRITFNDTQNGENAVNYKFWVCIFGCPKEAITSVRLDTITSVSKHTYNIANQQIREVTIDTTGNNSIRIYCMNVNKEQLRYKDRLKNTRELLESKTGTSSDYPSKKFPEGTYSHNVEYQVENVETLDKIYESVINAVIKNKGCTLKV